MFVSWASQNLRPASFRGVAFDVAESAGRSGGRAIVTHEFPLRDLPFNEDLGAATHTYEIDAVLVGDDVISRALALEAALDAPGPGSLVHPYYGALQVVVKSVRTHWRCQEGRVARFSITFVADAGAPSLQPTSAVSTPSLVESAASAVQSVLATAAEAVRVVQDAESFVVGEVQGVIGDIQGAVGTALGMAGAVMALGDPLLAAALAPLGVLTPATLGLGPVGALAAGLTGGAADTASLAAGWVAAAPCLVASLVPPRSDGSDSALAASLPIPTPANGAASGPLTVQGLITTLATGLVRPTLAAPTAFAALLQLAGDGTAANPGYQPGPRLPPLPASSLTPALAQLLGLPGGTPAALIGLPGVGAAQVVSALATPSRQAQATNRLAVTVLIRSAAATEAARVASRIVFASRNDADQAKASVSAALGAVADQVGDLGWDGVWSGLVALQAAAIRDLTVTEQPLPSLARYTPAAVLPAAVIAQRLYGDDPTTLFEQQADLIARNGVIHPAFVPAGPLEVLQWPT